MRNRRAGSWQPGRRRGGRLGPVGALLLLGAVAAGCTPEDGDDPLPAEATTVAAQDPADAEAPGHDREIGADLRIQSLPLPPGGFGEVEVEVRPGDTSMLVIATGSGPDDLVYIDRVVGPSVDFEPDQPVNAAENAVLVPSRDDEPFEAGVWRITVDSEQGLQGVTVVTKTSDPFRDQVIDLRVHVVTDGDRLATRTDRDELAEAYRERGEEILSPFGLGVGDLDFVDAPPATVEAFARLDVADEDAPALRELCQALTEQEGESRRLVLGIVETYVGEGVAGTEGIAAGTPGSAVLPGPTGCVTIAVDSGRDLLELATSVWHEVGHNLGLLHTTEEEGEVFDVLGDTPECPAERFDTDDSGFVDAEECAAADGENFMFYDSDGTEMTDGQAFVLRNHPLFRPA